MVKLPSNLADEVIVFFDGVVNGEKQRVKRWQQLVHIFVQKLLWKNDFWRDITHEKPIVWSQETV